MREIRFIGKEKSINVLDKKEDSIFTKLLHDNIDVKTITKEEIDSLLDVGVKLDGERKDLDGWVKKIKTILLEYAKDNSIREITSNISTAKISNTTHTNINPSKFVKLLKQLGKLNLFDKIMKVGITEAKKYIGLDDINSISDTATEEYGSVSIKNKR